MSTFLLEIGTEELPADFARLALPQLEAAVRRDLQDQRLSCSDVHCTSTPRRLVLSISGLPPAQPDLAEERKGPPAGQAFRDGAPTPAASGFANRCGVPVEALEVRDTPKGPCVFALVRQQGRGTAELLAELAPDWIAGLQGRRFMRWGAGDCRFSRPVRWLVALLDGQVVPLALPGTDPSVRAGRLSRGHRLQAEPVPISSAGSYAQDLAAAGVEVDRQARERAISGAIANEADRLGAEADLPQALREELTDLVEAPLLIEGSVAERYLALPPEVLCTVMR
ncbi:MAG: glycine--tRNA ligase subunit beta, partial [Cyanobacteriota bacterium]|nr:glycine--tRNA ligase subunit beta [Cyanobacteriota bacterium]